MRSRIRGWLFLQHCRDTMNPMTRAAVNIFTPPLLAFARPSPPRHDRDVVGGIGSNTHLFCRVPSEVCTSQQHDSLPGARRTLYLPGAACSAAGARPPALRGDLASPLISKHSASYFTPRLSRFIYTDRGCSETKEYFFFFTSKMFYIFGRVVFPFREVTYILTAVGGLF